MENYTTTIGGKTVLFTENHIQIEDTVLSYEKMSNIGYRGGDKPGFVFEYGGRKVMIPCGLQEKNAMYPFFQKAAMIDKKEKESPLAIAPEPMMAPEETAQPQNEPKGTRHLQCSKCGSSNVMIQNTEKTSFKQGHGCLWFIIFGIFYLSWILIKWSYKYMVAMCYWVFYGWIRLIVMKCQGKTGQVTPEWYRKMMRRRGKMYSDTVTQAVCQDCGNSWIVK